MKQSTIFLAKIDRETSTIKQQQYQGMIGSIIFSIVETRPKVGFATSVASCFAKNPGNQHTEAVKTILQYLKGTRDQDITYLAKTGSSLKDIQTLTRSAINRAKNQCQASFSC